MKKYRVRKYSVAWFTINALKAVCLVGSAMSFYLVMWLLG